MRLDRRDFLKMAAAMLAGWSAGSGAGALETVEVRNGMPYRRLGRTGEKVSLLCLGGSHIGQRSVSEKDSIAIQRTAIDEGVNFFDNAWAYHDGRSEELMGKALKDGYRDKVFLMTKHKGRDPESARRYLEESLKRLDVDVIDLWQFHEVVRPEEPGMIFESGAIEEALKARDEGKIRYIGCTGHHIPSIQAEMITRGFPWDTIQVPLNIFDHHFRSFESEVLPKAVEKDIGVIAMKTLGGTPAPIPRKSEVSPADCLRYAMNLPVATVCSGIDTIEFLRYNLNVAKSFQPMTAEELADILARSREPALDGKYETYKTAWHRDIQKAIDEAASAADEG